MLQAFVKKPAQASSQPSNVASPEGKASLFRFPNQHKGVRRGRSSIALEEFMESTPPSKSSQLSAASPALRMSSPKVLVFVGLTDVVDLVRQKGKAIDNDAQTEGSKGGKVNVLKKGRD